MSSMPKMGHRELVIAAAGPCQLGETHMRVFERLAKRAGDYSPETISKFWKGQYESKRLRERLQTMADQAEALARADRIDCLSLSYSHLARRLHSLAGRR